MKTYTGWTGTVLAGTREGLLWAREEWRGRKTCQRHGVVNGRGGGRWLQGGNPGKLGKQEWAAGVAADVAQAAAVVTSLTEAGVSSRFSVLPHKTKLKNHKCTEIHYILCYYGHMGPRENWADRGKISPWYMPKVAQEDGWGIILWKQRGPRRPWTSGNCIETQFMLPLGRAVPLFCLLSWTTNPGEKTSSETTD